MKELNFIIGISKRNFWYIALLCLASLSLFYACSKKDSFSKNGGKVTLTINVGGANDEGESLKLKASNNLSNLLDQVSSSEVNRVSNSNGKYSFDIVSEQNDFHEDFDYTGFDTKLGNKLSATIPMQKGIKYRFLLYNTTSKAFEVSVVAVAGQTLHISAASGQTYRWYAYSFNNSDDIPSPDLENPVLTTRVDSPLLYASGSITPVSDNTQLPIVFNHQLTQLKVRIDSRGMFANIEQLTGEFVGDYVKTTSFDIISGKKIGVMSSVNVGSFNFENEDIGSSRIKVAKYYTADASLSSYEVKINSLSVQYPNNIVESLDSRLPNGGVVKFDNYSTPNVSTILNGTLKLWLVLPTKKILLYGNHSGWGYAAEAGKASGSFLRSSYNFGVTSKYLKVDGFIFDQVNAYSGGLTTRLSNPANYPDVIVIGIFSGYASQADYTALEKYLRSGGVVFLMTENLDDPLKKFLNSILNSNISLKNHDTGGTLYKLADVDPDVLNGVFGDVRGKMWGQDASGSLYINGYTGNDIVVYSRQSENYPAPSAPIGITMFRHKTLNLFFVGDTGHLASGLTDGTYLPSEYYGAGPFATVGGSGANKSFPNVRMYGHYPLSGTPLYSQGNIFHPIYNSFLFGNVFSWMLERSHFAGIDRTK